MGKIEKPLIQFGTTKKRITKMEDIPIGEYYPFDDKWEVRLDKESWFTCERQTEAEILSRLVRLEREIKKLRVSVKNVG